MPIDLRHSVYKRKGRAGWTLEYREAGTTVQRSFPRKIEAEAAWERHCASFEDGGATQFITLHQQQVAARRFK